MNEEQLIERAKAGDVSAFNRLVLAYQDAVYNYTLRILRDPAAADDATQQAFISAYKAIRRFRTGHFKAWLFRIAHNKCLDMIRRHGRRPIVSIDEDRDEGAPLILRDDKETPDQSAERAAVTEAIEHCFNGLGDGQRAAVLLCDVEGYDYAEIAAILNISLGTVKSRINRARRKLQVCLRGFGELLPEKYR